MMGLASSGISNTGSCIVIVVKDQILKVSMMNHRSILENCFSLKRK